MPCRRLISALAPPRGGEKNNVLSVPWRGVDLISVTDNAAPVSAAERIQLMDVLRGVALFGVFLVNFTAFAGAPIMATEQQLLSLPDGAVRPHAVRCARLAVHRQGQHAVRLPVRPRVHAAVAAARGARRRFRSVVSAPPHRAARHRRHAFLLRLDLGHPAPVRARRFPAAAASTAQQSRPGDRRRDC